MNLFLFSIGYLIGFLLFIGFLVGFCAMSLFIASSRGERKRGGK